MVTGKSLDRIPLARNSILSFLAQTYENRYLVIVNDGDFWFDLAGLEEGRIIQLHPEKRMSLGLLRNVALDSIPKDAIWVLWDDDDWHHPELLSRQTRILTGLEVHTCLLRHQVKYRFSTGTAFADSYNGGFGGTIMSRNTGLRFPDVRRAEDSAYCKVVKQDLSWFAWDNPAHLFIRFYHEKNTWDEDHFRFEGRGERAWEVSAEAEEHLRAVLPLYAS
jgi:glycosyltransferase involved in cell wall biosynthesis